MKARDLNLMIIACKQSKTLLKVIILAQFFICSLMKIQSNQRVCQFSKITLQIYFLTLTYVSAHDIYVNINKQLKKNTEIYTKNNHEKLIICTIKLTDKSRKSNRFWSNDIENLNFFVIICTGKRYFNLVYEKHGIKR